MEAWALFTLGAALMQSVRTAGQKRLANHLSPMTTTLVRYLFGAPFAIIYLGLVFTGNPFDALVTSLNNRAFLIYASLAGVAQVAATFWLVKVLSFRNFAVGTVFAKTEAVQTAALGLIFFGAILSWIGWLAIILGAIGILAISIPGNGQRPDSNSVIYGSLAGIGFALTSLWLRQASISLPHTFIQNAAITLVYMVLLQTLICLLYVICKERMQLSLLLQQLPLALFVGATSALGSIGWYTAMTYQNAALVKALGQIELVFAILITNHIFNEKIAIREFMGIAATVLSVLILLLFV